MNLSRTMKKKDILDLALDFVSFNNAYKVKTQRITRIKG